MNSTPARDPNAPDFSRSAVARYLQLSTLFRRRIESGEWPIGAQIPTVDDLVAECGVARATVRHALSVLENEALIERFRAKGTYVRKRPEENLWCDVEADWSGLLRARDGATIEVLSGPERTSLADIPHPVGKRCDTYVHLRRRHWRDGVPFLLADIYYEASVFERIPEECWETTSALRILVDSPKVDIGDARQTLTIGTADMETARLLQMSLNAPVARVSRSAIDTAGRLIFVGHGLYRGDVVRVDVKLK
jgi:GntR family transcriptional regulator